MPPWDYGADRGGECVIPPHGIKVLDTEHPNRLIREAVGGALSWGGSLATSAPLGEGGDQRLVGEGIPCPRIL